MGAVDVTCLIVARAHYTGGRGEPATGILGPHKVLLDQV